MMNYRVLIKSGVQAVITVSIVVVVVVVVVAFSTATRYIAVINRYWALGNK